MANANNYLSPTSVSPEYIKRYLELMNQSYKKWYSSNKSQRDDGFDSFYYDNILPQMEKKHGDKQVLYKIQTSSDPSKFTMMKEADMSEKLKSKIAKGIYKAEIVSSDALSGGGAQPDDAPFFDDLIKQYLMPKNKSLVSSLQSKGKEAISIK